MLNRSLGVLVVFLAVLAAAFGPSRSLRVLASPHSGAHAAATKCQKGYKLVNGKCKKIKKPKPTPTPTDSPCTTLACQAPSKYWKWTVFAIVSGPNATTSYKISGTTCGRPATSPWTVQYDYAFDSNGDVTTHTFYDDNKTTLVLPQDRYITFPLVASSSYPNPPGLKIELQFDLHGHIRPGISYADEITPRVTIRSPYKVKGLPAAGSAIPVSDCASG